MRRHTVHTRHPRYKVNQYDRGNKGAKTLTRSNPQPLKKIKSGEMVVVYMPNYDPETAEWDSIAKALEEEGYRAWSIRGESYPLEVTDKDGNYIHVTNMDYKRHKVQRL